jgi:hypothetical protein
MSTEMDAPHLADLLGRLDQHALRDAFARAAGVDQVASWSAGIARRISGCVGYGAAKALIAVEVIDHAGQRARVELVLKHFAGWKGRGEAIAYRWLESVGAPVPRFAGALRDENGDEVLLIELLPHVGCDWSDDRQVEVALSAMARLNAAPVPPDGILAQGPKTPADVAAGAVAELPRIIEDARAGLLGDEIGRLIADAGGLWSGLERHLAPAVAELERFPVGLIHGDASDQNMGWRAGRQELVMFDLTNLHRGCILSDMIIYTGGIGAERDERLARHWLAELQRAGGPAIDLGAFARGRAASGRLRNVATWWWQRARAVDGKVDWTSDREEGRRSYRSWLGGTLSTLRDEMAAPAVGRVASGGAP